MFRKFLKPSSSAMGSTAEAVCWEWGWGVGVEVGGWGVGVEVGGWGGGGFRVRDVA